MSEPSMMGRDIWVKYHSAKGESYVSYHRVWDADRFLKSRQAEAAKTGGRVEQVPKPERLKGD